MTREQVKQELNELKAIRKLFQKGIDADDKKGLEKKYDKAMSNLNYEEKTILFHHAYLNEPYFKIGMLLNYSEATIRKKYSKIIDKLANMVEIKKTNFDRISESVESLAEYIYQVTSCCPFKLIGVVAPCTILLSNNGCTNCIKEWLQKECEG